jgi:hypothetical protein
MTKLTTISFTLALAAGSASAQPKATPATPATPAAKGAPAMPAPPAAEKKAAPPAKPEAPKPPKEIADAIKAMAGTWKCTGTAEMGGQTGDVKATITMRSDLNGYWMQTSFTGTMAKMPPMKFTSFTSYDEANKKFYRVMVNAHGGHGTAWGTVADKKISWDGDARWMGQDVKMRETEEMVSPKEVKVLGEYSKDGGKTWTKDHEATCKK